MLSSLFQFAGSVHTTQGIQQDILTHAHSPPGFRRGTFDTPDKRELSAHRPNRVEGAVWRSYWHTHTHTQGFNCQQHQPGWPYSHSHPRWWAHKEIDHFKKKKTYILLHMQCPWKLTTVPRGKKKKKSIKRKIHSCTICHLTIEREWDVREKRHDP